MISERFSNDGHPSEKLNPWQLKAKLKVEEKILTKEYSFESVSCCLCNSLSFDEISRKDRYGLFYPVKICKQCGLVQANPRLDEKSYKKFYSEDYRNLYVGTDGPKEEFFLMQKSHGKIIFNLIKSKTDCALNGINVFEVGTGAGGILEYFREEGNYVSGCDLGEDYLKYGVEKYNLNLHNGTLNEIKFDRKFDLIILSHVLEHFSNPIEQLIKIREIMFDEGFIYVELPGLFNLKNSYKGDLLLYLQNAHTYNFTLKNLTHMMNLVGYELIFGNEVISAVYKKSQIIPGKNFTSENDYIDTIKYLKEVERFRYLYRLNVFIRRCASKLLRHFSIFG